MKFILFKTYGVMSLVCSFLVCSSTSLLADTMEDCILKRFKSGGDSMTIGEIKQACAEQIATRSVKIVSPVDDRLDMDDRNTLEPFTLMAHKPNFFMMSYDWSREDINNYGGVAGVDIDLDYVELQFQVSLKTPVAMDLFDWNIDVYAAYTNRSFWQAFNDEDQNSAFFRETNHEPEIWVQKRHNIELPLGFQYKLTGLGLVHQSNGRSGVRSVNPEALSRSWNRGYARLIFQKGNVVIGVKPWLRIPEPAEEDDNDDITKYLGHGELRLMYKLDEHTFALMTRNNLESRFRRGAVEASWSFPIWNYPYVKGYVQYFTGYGESLADYDQYNNRVGVGVCLSDWL